MGFQEIDESEDKKQLTDARLLRSKCAASWDFSRSLLRICVELREFIQSLMGRWPLRAFSRMEEVGRLRGNAAGTVA